MPKDKKKNVDIDGLSTLMRNGLIIIGLLIIIGYYVLKWIGFSQFANFSILIVIFGGILILAIKARKFNHNKKTKQNYLVSGIAIVFVLGLVFYGFSPTKTIINKESIKFTGMYGFEMKIQEVESIELVNEIPSVKIRTNGFSLGSVNKGTFKLKDWGKCKLLLHAKNHPFLIINNKNGEKIIINDKNPTTTKENYHKIKLLTEK